MLLPQQVLVLKIRLRHQVLMQGPLLHLLEDLLLLEDFTFWKDLLLLKDLLHLMPHLHPLELLLLLEDLPQIEFPHHQIHHPPPLIHLHFLLPQNPHHYLPLLLLELLLLVPLLVEVVQIEAEVLQLELEVKR